MNENRRVACFFCGEQVLVNARLCPHCSNSLLISIRLEAGLQDGGARYRLARNLVALAPHADFLAVKKALDRVGSDLLSSLTREVADRALLALEEAGGRGRLEYATPGEESVKPPSSQSRKRIQVMAMLVVVMAVVLIARWSGRPLAKQTLDDQESPTLSLAEIAKQALPATVTVRCGDQQGAGFFVRADRIVTNAHVLCDDFPEVETSDGRTLEAQVYEEDTWLDLALLEVDPQSMEVLALGDATALAIGDSVVAIGNPHGLDFTVTPGTVSQDVRVMMGILYIQVDANINAGNSGGPLLDSKGRVVGVVTMMAGEGSGLGLALPVNYLNDDPSPIMSEVVSRPDNTRWLNRLDEADRLEQKEISEVMESLDHPYLGGAYLEVGRRSHSLSALVIQAGESSPEFGRLDFTLEREGEILCTARGAVDSWSKVGEYSDMDFDSRTLDWLKRHEFSFHLFAGYAPVSGCSYRIQKNELNGLELVMDGGGLESSRTPVRLTHRYFLRR